MNRDTTRMILINFQPFGDFGLLALFSTLDGC
jgi:hypothetical protein